MLDEVGIAHKQKVQVGVKDDSVSDDECVDVVALCEGSIKE